MLMQFKGVRIRSCTSRKLQQIKRIRRWSLCDMVDLWADRELSLIKSAKQIETKITTREATRPPGSTTPPMPRDTAASELKQAG